MEVKTQFTAALVGAAIGGIVATLVTGDALALVVAFVAGPCVFFLVGAVLNPDDSPPPSAAMYAFVLVGAMAAGGAALSYILFGVWVAVVAVVLLVAAIIISTLAWLNDGG